MNGPLAPSEFQVLGTPITAGSFESAISKVSTWADLRQSRSVFFCNVHSVVTARMDNQFRDVLRTADMCLPDGAPVARLVRRAGSLDQRRVSGPDVMSAYFRVAESKREAVFLYGSTPTILEQLCARLKVTHPNLVVHSFSPPYRDLTTDEDTEIVDLINVSGASTVWVALGCPKQERFIAEHRGRINAVMLGVGAAFAFHAGVISRAPKWMQRNGLEWLHRLVTDPKRLWRRYLHTNSAFIYFVLSDALSGALRRTLRASQLK